ncbi:MAG: hypothetical protein LBT78_02990 [Tannerella sp.]|jgi:hypothetical protein|nr:hypothetical protein [Tannerella sp.]
MNKKIIILCLILSGYTASYSQRTSQSLLSLAKQFDIPAGEYHPWVWWHWMGSNFTKEGITKDLEAMKEAGIGGAVIFNITSSVQESWYPMENNPWPEQTFRSEAYWDAFRHTLSEAKRLNLKIGLHGTPGYATTGGPWISEEQSMQTLVISKTKVSGKQMVDKILEIPELPVYEGWGTTNVRAKLYKDIAVMAVPDDGNTVAAEVEDISGYMDASGHLEWHAPEGQWMICRIGHASTMAVPHPLPDEIIGKSWEVDKMSRELNIYHWQQVLKPLKEHLQEYIGNTFEFIWVDSYEAGGQNWTAQFREEFIRLKGYDPLPWVTLQQVTENTRDDVKNFAIDYKDVINRLFIDNGWQVAKEMLHEAGLQFYWEPYCGPKTMFDFNTLQTGLGFYWEKLWAPWDVYESVSIPDLPVSEFWTFGGDANVLAHKDVMPYAARQYGKRVLAAEAFTGRPEISQYTEDPAFLKRSADGAYVAGANWFFLHHWVHQPFDDKYQPGMGFGWWGTHFGRHQTWIKPAKAFFTYLSRCQMMLQQGSFVSYRANINHRSTPEAEIFFVINPSTSVEDNTFVFPVKNRVPELWDAYSGTIRHTPHWTAQGDSTQVSLTLEPGGSLFVVFPYKSGNYPKLPSTEILDETVTGIDGAWEAFFSPKLGQPFKKTLPTLIDFGKHSDTEIKYFSGTARYEKVIRVAAGDIGKNRRVLLDLGELHDIAELEVNGIKVAVLWFPPYKTEVTPWLKAGNNKITVHVTTNWANRLIGDEQYPANFEWGRDRGKEQGRAMKAFPDWFLNNQDPPSEGRKTFNIWYYYREDSPLQPAGLLGPVRFIKQIIKL